MIYNIPLFLLFQQSLQPVGPLVKPRKSHSQESTLSESRMGSVANLKL